MLGRTVGCIAASALSVQALLLPPGTASVDFKGKGGLSTFGLELDSQSIKLPCPDCVSSTPSEKIESEDGDDTFWIQGGANSVLLNFTVGNDGASMGLNGYTLYPPSVNFDKPQILQVPSSASLVDIMGSANVQSVKISADTIFVNEESVSPAGDAVIRVKYQLLAVDNHPISVDGAEVTMLKDPEGQLMILNLESVPKAESIFDSLPPAMDHAVESKPAKDCGNLPALFCKLKNAAESKMEELKASMPKVKGGCHGKKLPGHIKPHLHNVEDKNIDGRPHNHHGRPPKGMRPHHGPHGHHGHHPHAHHHMHAMHKVVGALFMVLIPIMAGITVGMTVSLIGMLVGRLIAFLWIKFARGGRRGYASVAQEEVQAEEGEGEKGVIVIEEFEPLPRYEDAPAYEESEQK